jgi:hypothetical protein
VKPAASLVGMVDDSHRSRRSRLAQRFGLTGLATIRAAVGSDFRSARWRQRLALLAVCAWLAYEWGPGNETVNTLILARVIENNSGVVVIPVTAAVAMLFTLAQQLGSGFTALAGFSLFDRTAQASWQKLRGTRDSAPGEWSGLSWVARASISFGLGTTAVALIQIMTTGEVGVRRHARAVAASALLCSVIIAFVGGGAASIAYLGRRVEPLAGSTRLILRVLENPLFWLGFLVLLALIHAARRHPPTVPSTAGSTTTEPM